jgi:putative ABC transport system ATP-binding protein
MLQAINISKEYRSGEPSHIALSNINFYIEEGDYVMFLGPSGSGKTSLVNIVGMLDYPTSGDLLFKGKSVVEMNNKERLIFRRGEIGYVFNEARLIEELTIAENIALPLVYKKIKRSERKRKVADVLGQMNLLHRKNHFPKDLTSLQQQKASIARAMVSEPSLVIADEPTANLNSTDGSEILRILSEINEKGTTLLFFTHSAIVAGRGNRVVELFDGHLVGENAMK